MNEKPIAAGKSSFSYVDKELLKEVLFPLEGLVILDAACGAGNYTLALARWAGVHSQIYALDLWDDGIFELRQQLDNAGFSHVQAHVVDISQGTGLAPESVDLCLAATFLHDFVSLGKAEGALEALHRSLKPGGRLVAIEFRKIPPPPGPPESLRLSFKELETLVTPLGFSLKGEHSLGEILYALIFEKIPEELSATDS
ncbi:class I SAM-dependent methyltransferase [Desulfococcaceae bacterium OttesenSCG-928-F15]|nr:class I SAM-dependent methyltransferase [Desulfococcaceae bacterium OttesenSCG-928-F15]